MESIIIILLVAISLIGLTFIVERGLALRWRKVIPAGVQEAVESCRASEDLPMLKRMCDQHSSPVSRLLLAAQEHLDWPREDNAGTLQTIARHELSRLENGLVILEIIIGVAPLLGLVGTISGLIHMFGSLGASGVSDNSSAFAQGVGEALWATFLGLITAIPSLIAWNYYSRKIDSLGIEMERLCDEFLRRQYRQDGRRVMFDQSQTESQEQPAGKSSKKSRNA